MRYSPDSEPFIMKWGSKLGTFLGLSVCWLLCCLPVLTIMPACIALYDSVVNCVHGEEPSPIRHFFTTLRQELGRGIGLSALWIGVWAVFIYGFALVNGMGKANSIFAVYTVIYAGSALIPLMMLLWVIPLQVKFRLGFFELHRKAMSLVIIHLPTTLAVLGMLIGAAMLSIFLLPLLLLTPAILTTLQAPLTEKVLTLYETEEEMK